MKRIDRLQFALDQIVKRERIGEEEFKEILNGEFNDSDEVNAVLDKLKLDAIISSPIVYKEEDSYYEITVYGIEYAELGYIKRHNTQVQLIEIERNTKINQYELSKKNLNNYVNPKITIAISIMALIISAIALIINYTRK